MGPFWHTKSEYVKELKSIEDSSHIANADAGVRLCLPDTFCKRFDWAADPILTVTQGMYLSKTETE